MSKVATPSIWSWRWWWRWWWQRVDDAKSWDQKVSVDHQIREARVVLVIAGKNTRSPDDHQHIVSMVFSSLAVKIIFLLFRSDALRILICVPHFKSILILISCEFFFLSHLWRCIRLVCMYCSHEWSSFWLKPAWVTNLNLATINREWKYKGEINSLFKEEFL